MFLPSDMTDIESLVEAWEKPEREDRNKRWAAYLREDEKAYLPENVPHEKEIDWTKPVNVLLLRLGCERKSLARMHDRELHRRIEEEWQQNDVDSMEDWQQIEVEQKEEMRRFILDDKEGMDTDWTLIKECRSKGHNWDFTQSTQRTLIFWRGMPSMTCTQCKCSMRFNPPLSLDIRDK